MQVVNAEHEYAGGSVKWVRSSQSVPVESPHPVGATTWTKVVTIPGASSLTVTFDEASAGTVDHVRVCAPFVLSSCA